VEESVDRLRLGGRQRLVKVDKRKIVDKNFHTREPDGAGTNSP